MGGLCFYAFVCQQFELSFLFELFTPFRRTTYRRLADSQLSCDFNGAKPQLSMRPETQKRSGLDGLRRFPRCRCLPGTHAHHPGDAVSHPVEIKPPAFSLYFSSSASPADSRTLFQNRCRLKYVHQNAVAAPGVFIQAFHVFRQTGSQRVQMDVPDRFLKTGVLLAQNGFVEILEKRPVSSVLFVEPARISDEKAVHERGNGNRAGSQQQMGVVRQNRRGERLFFFSGINSERRLRKFIRSKSDRKIFRRSIPLMVT